MSDKRLLIISNDEDAVQMLQNIAINHGYLSVHVNALSEIQSIYMSFKPTLLILDLYFGEIDAIVLLNYLCNIDCKGAIIILGTTDKKLLITLKHIGEQKNLNIVDVISRPIIAGFFEEKLIALEKLGNDLIDSRQITMALENNHFLLHYQPKVNLLTKKLCGVEALLRLVGNDGTIVPPTEFIPIAEESNLIIPLTHWVIQQVFETCSKFHLKNPDVHFAINLSPKILSDVVFPDEMAKLLKLHGVNPKNISFEITESGISHQSEVILEVLTRLRLLGFSLSIDDFGTGYSSIAELHRLPFTELKIDQGFVADMMSNHESQIIVRSTIDLGHNLGLEVVAEGIENYDSMKILEELGCDIVQGYLFSQPITMDDLNTWCTKNLSNCLVWSIKE